MAYWWNFNLAASSSLFVATKPPMHVGVTADVLGRRVHDDVGAQSERRCKYGVANVLSTTSSAPWACA